MTTVSALVRPSAAPTATSCAARPQSPYSVSLLGMRPCSSARVCARGDREGGGGGRGRWKKQAAARHAQALNKLGTNHRGQTRTDPRTYLTCREKNITGTQGLTRTTRYSRRGGGGRAGWRRREPLVVRSGGMPCCCLLPRARLVLVTCVCARVGKEMRVGESKEGGEQAPHVLACGAHA